MRTYTKNFFTIILLFSIATDVFADKGIGKKSKNKIAINIIASSNIRNSIGFNLKSGLSYKGSLLNAYNPVSSSSIINTSIATYKKGNTTYIIPYKSRITVTDTRQGYTGIKMIIRKK